MVPTKLYLIIAGVAAHWHVEGDDSSIKLLAKSLRNIAMHPIRSRRLTRRDVLKTIIASSLFILCFTVTVCGFAFYSVAQVHKPQLHLVAKYPRDILPGGFAERVRRVFGVDSAKLSKTNYKSSTGVIGSNSQPLWDLENMVGQFVGMPQCNHNATLLVLITSARENFSQRKVIRDTWCSKQQVNEDEKSPSVQCVFLVGQDHRTLSNATTTKHLTSETVEYGDILLANYGDTYRNLTYKVLSGFLWSSQHCSVPYVLKTDDDCFVNVALFSRVLRARGIDSGIYVGRVFQELKETQVIRDSRSKWAVMASQYLPDFYPPYASGIGYLMSSDVVASFIQASKYLLPFPNEDAYMGVLAYHLGIQPIDSGRFTYNMHFAVCNLLYILVIHHVGAIQQHDLLSMTSNAPLKCKMSDLKTMWN